MGRSRSRTGDTHSQVVFVFELLPALIASVLPGAGVRFRVSFQRSGVHEDAVALTALVTLGLSFYSAYGLLLLLRLLGLFGRFQFGGLARLTPGFGTVVIAVRVGGIVGEYQVGFHSDGSVGEVGFDAPVGPFAPVPERDGGRQVSLARVTDELGAAVVRTQTHSSRPPQRFAQRRIAPEERSGAGVHGRRAQTDSASFG